MCRIGYESFGSGRKRNCTFVFAVFEMLYRSLNLSNGSKLFASSDNLTKLFFQ